MSYPYITAMTAGVILIMQIVLAYMVSDTRGKAQTSLGDGGNNMMLKSVRRHGNLAENAGLFIAAFSLLELSRFSPTLLIILCVAFVISRVLHAIGMSQAQSTNVMRFIGGVGTYIIGLVLGGCLVWIGMQSMMVKV